MVYWDPPAPEVSLERLLLEFTASLLMIVGLLLAIDYVVSWGWLAAGAVVMGSIAGVMATSFGHRLNERTKQISQSTQRVRLAIIMFGVPILIVASWIVKPQVSPEAAIGATNFFLGSSGTLLLVQLSRLFSHVSSQSPRAAD